MTNVQTKTASRNRSQRFPTGTVLLIAMLLGIATLAATAQTQVFVPGNASGNFGNPSDLVVPFVPAITVTGPATITVTYVSGLVHWDTFGHTAGPKGVPRTQHDGQSHTQVPLQEAAGIAGGEVENLAALIGVFVTQSRVQDPRGFVAIDGTKNNALVGIVPSHLVLIGESKTFTVTGPGTLYLGINDGYVFDNSGGFTVEVTAIAR